VRRVAAELGVRPNALYTYVADRAALERSLVEWVMHEADVDLLAGPARSWRRRIVRYALSLRDALLAHPAVAPLMMTAPMDGPAALTVGEALLGAFGDAGLRGREPARACWALIVYVVGAVALDVADTDGRAPLPEEAERVAERAARLAAVPTEAFPLTAAAVGTMAAWVGRDQFLWGLERLLDGIGGAGVSAAGTSRGGGPRRPPR
jgi:TetR/AcrR family transcriptional regulator, tetracycline repressor protein